MKMNRLIIVGLLLLCALPVRAARRLLTSCRQQRARATIRLARRMILARSLEAQGRFAAAQAEYQKAAALDPGSADAVSGVARTRHREREAAARAR